MDAILQVENLKTSFFTSNGEVQAVRGVSFSVNKGDILGIVGESGSGKSVTSMSILKLLADTGRVKEGTILFEGQDLAKFNKTQMRKIRGGKISMIFQDPMSSLNPLIPVGKQVAEMLKEHHKEMGKEELKKEVLELFSRVRIPEPEKRYNSYPHEFSGGMRQRVMIAMALSCDPELLIADEPTTALDVTIQAQIVELLKDLKEKLGMAIIFITHDLGVVSEICDKIIVMYAGKIVEEGKSRQIFYERCHPYTEGLLASVPRLESDVNEKLKPIKGNPPDMSAVKPGCAFAPRCSCAMKICVREEPPEYELDETHKASCWQVIKKAMQNT